ncbi:MAG: hypothetical protein ACRC8Y_13340 [Chroococcales cyanobacterium]
MITDQPDGVLPRTPVPSKLQGTRNWVSHRYSTDAREGASADRLLGQTDSGSRG